MCVCVCTCVYTQDAPCTKHKSHVIIYLPVHQLQCNSKSLHTMTLTVLNHLLYCTQAESTLAEEPWQRRYITHFISLILLYLCTHCNMSQS